MRTRFWSLTDQGLSSLSNLAVSILAARTAGVTGFGAFGVAFSIYLAVLAVSRSLVGDNLLYRSPSDRDSSDWLQSVAAVPVTATILGGITGLCMVIAGLFLPYSSSMVLEIVGAGMPLLVLQDSVRYLDFAEGRPTGAALNDGLWLVVVLAGFALVPHLGKSESSLSVVCVLWIAGAGVGVVSSLLFHRRPWNFRAIAYLRAEWPRSRTLLPDYLLTAVSSFAMLPVLAAVGGLRATASIRAGQILLGPISVLSVGLSVVSVPSAARSFAAGRREVVPRVILISGGAVALLSTIAGLLWSVAPTVLLTAVLGPSAQAARSVVIWIGLIVALGALSFVGTSSLRVRNLGSRAVLIRIFSVPVTLGAGIIGVLTAGPVGASIGITLAGLLTIALVAAMLYSTRDRPRDNDIRI